jgi:hypothetical protein
MTPRRSKPLFDPESHVGAGEGFKTRLDRLNPFWGPRLVVLGAILLDVSLPEKLTIGPSWLLPSVEGLLLAGLVIASPHPRMRPETRPDFLFPQMDKPEFAPPGWMPQLIDYLYVSLTNATAFSPTDTMPLTQIAKVLMSVQSIVALVTIGLVVARAVNILQ